jgi:hypothetical protein
MGGSCGGFGFARCKNQMQSVGYVAYLGAFEHTARLQSAVQRRQVVMRHSGV